MRIPQPRVSTDVRWADIESFPGYLVSDLGHVLNEDTGHVLTQFVNPSGVAYVTFKSEGRNYSRAIGPLVARAYLPPPPNEWFDTPIHLDGDRTHNAHWNLVWRPRWFALKYVQQFEGPYVEEDVRIRILETGEELTCWQAVTRFGLLYSHVLVAAASDDNKSPFASEFHFALNVSHTNTAGNRRL